MVGASKIKLLKNMTRRQAKILQDLSVGQENEVIKNPYSGVEVELEPRAVALYDFIKGAEILSEYENLQAGLDLFRELYPEAYMDLLD